MFVALLVLLVLTVAGQLLNLGTWGTVIGVTIAVVKALLIILFFMHVRYSNRLVQLFAAAGFVWLGILIVGALQDYISRGWIPGAGR